MEKRKCKIFTFKNNIIFVFGTRLYTMSLVSLIHNILDTLYYRNYSIYSMTFQMATKIVWRAQILWQYRRADGPPPRFNVDYIYKHIKLLHSYTHTHIYI